jgi:hypothetical protein
MINDITEILNFRFNHMHLTWNLKREDKEKYLKHYPEVYKYFEYVLHKDIQINKNLKNKNVFCHTYHIKLLPKLMNGHSDSFNNLVIMGDDIHFSAQIHQLKQIKDRFKKIYYEAKDIDCEWVQTFPMGGVVAYMLRNGGDNAILPQINKKKNKTKLIASAFGSKWPNLTRSIADRSKLKKFTSNSDFMNDMFCEPDKYYENLCDYRFFACPLGNGIQTPKICECIMCETVPVVTDHVAHRELRDIYGLPLLIVNEWSDITEEFLNEQWYLVYSKIDWHEQKNKFLVNNFNKLLI